MASLRGSLPEREVTRFRDIEFNIHEFANDSTPRHQRSKSDVLRRGYHLIKSATTKRSGWRNATRIQEQESRGKCVNAFVYNKMPPSITSEKTVVVVCKEWGSVVSDDEIFNLEDLEDFQITKMAPLSASESPQSQMLNKRLRDMTPVIESPQKRRKLNLGPLYNLIPKPHIHPSPLLVSVPPLKSRSFKKTEPTFVTPYTTLPLPHGARVAWMIPVRGSFQWEGCTSGCLLESTSGAPFPVEPNEIMWTQPSLLKFWNFLLDLRRLGPLGALGVSFHSTKDHSLMSVLPSTNGNCSFTPPASASNSVCSIEARFNFSKVDYIKVYHDASRAFYVRNALDLWSYQPVEHSEIRKIRVLKGARLALVDDVSQGILIS